MQKKEQEIDSVQIAWLVQEMKPLVEGAFVNKIQELEGNCIKFKLHSKSGGLELIISPKAIYLTNYRQGPLQNPKGFAGFLKKHLDNRLLHKLWQKGMDRVVVLEFEDFYLACEFFDDGNIVLCDKEWKILQPFHRGEWKDRKLAKGETYKFPQNIPEQKMRELEKRLLEEKKPEGFLESIDEQLSKGAGKSKEEEKKKTRQETKKAKMLASIKEQEKAVEKFEKDILENQKKAELIYKNSQEIQELLDALRNGKEKGFSEKEIEERILEAKKQGNYGARLIEDIRLKEKRLKLKLE